MKTKTQHTPTPWIFIKGEPRWVGKLLPNGSNQLIADCVHTVANRDEQEANAAFIVRAVNSHEALTSMLKKVHEEGAGIHYDEISELIKQAEAV